MDQATQIQPEDHLHDTREPTFICQLPVEVRAATRVRGGGMRELTQLKHDILGLYRLVRLEPQKSGRFDRSWRVQRNRVRPKVGTSSAPVRERGQVSQIYIQRDGSNSAV